MSKSFAVSNGGPAPAPEARQELGAKGSKLERHSPQNVVFAKERPEAGDHENPGRTLESTDISVAQRLRVALTPEPLPCPLDRDGVLIKSLAATCLLPPRLSVALGFVWQWRNRGEARVSQTYGF
ncbi:hypothetical protein Y1Q_0011990 [Alligator mississippiensis]|uniref:Uncharacterized protein n=1 Tax=Alligator mississippiensis TaxID=8496 RepID=A0A151NGS1_ALLMI|nr:hypothetical protein Y1Q_0011990 [Alligator mississippiensis]